MNVPPTCQARPSPVSNRVRRAAHSFGLTLADLEHSARSAPDAAAVDALLNSDGLVLITGPSGAGKTTLLRNMALRLGPMQCIVSDGPASLLRIDRPAVDLFRGSLSATMRLLAAVGLAEARIMLRPARQLSEGERARLALARAMHEAERCAAEARAPVTLLVDEFGSTLDRAAAWCLARTVARWVRTRHGGGSGQHKRHAPIRLVCATAHDDLAEALAPDVVVRVQHDGAVAAHRPDPATFELIQDRIHIRRGTRQDLAALSHLHYRRSLPATIAQILAADDRRTGALAGVLAVSMPTLNSPVRDLAWPGRYRSGDRRRDARRINAELRTISRVLVRPGYRGVGIGSMLVRTYLGDPLTPGTEAIAAMGAASPVLERAGMTAYRLPARQRDVRLADALEALRIRPWEVAEPTRVLRALRQRPDSAAAMLDRELRLWADASRSTRAAARSADLRTLLILAARSRVGLEGTGYAFSRA